MLTPPSVSQITSPAPMKNPLRFVLLALLLSASGGLLLTTSRPRPQGGEGTPAAAAQSAGAGGALGMQAPVPAAVPANRLAAARHAEPAGTSAVPGGQRKRAWDYSFLASLRNVARGAGIRFELVAGEFAAGIVRHTEFHEQELTYVAGELTAPESGRFFFQKQTGPGKAGDFAGVVEFPTSRRAFRLEPTGLNGATELVERGLGEVICLTLPPPVDALKEEIPPLDPSDHPDYPIPDYQEGIIPLQSLPGATGVLYIDFRGGYTPTWGGITYERPNVSNAEIKDVWKRVAEDYMPFRVNVTTDIKVYQAAPETSRQRVICTPTTTAAPGAGGVAYMNSWNWSGDTPCWSFYSSGKAAAEVVSHEAGHTLTLGHDGRTSPSEGYYGGQGSGVTGWAPIMGVGYYQPVVQWSRGEYASANNTEDDLAKIVGNNNSVAYRADDTGNALVTARYLETYPGGGAFAEGVIETTGDSDAFRFTTTGGAVSLRADPAPGEWANLAIQATLHDAAGNLIVSNNPQSQLWASISTTVTNGTYTFRVTGVGRNDPVSTGFSSYSSLGYYSVTGTVANARLPDRMSVAENSPAGTAVGVVAATNPNNDPLSYTITAGNTSSAFTINSTGLVTVANSAALNYETLAAATQRTVQFELFVNIVNLANPLLTETNRRVVVQLLDVNEPPVLTGFTNIIIAGTRTGTAVGTVAANDPDYYTILNFSLVSGNTNGLFVIGAQSGVITVAGVISNAHIGTYDLTVRAVDTSANPTSAVANVRITIITNQSPFQPGFINYAVYDGIGSGTLVTDLTGNSRFPTDPTWEKPMAQFEADTDRADNFGAAMRAYLIPPITGSYTFWIASDDSSDLRLSTTTNPAAASVVASVNNAWTSPRQWTAYPSQMSASRTLYAGQAYYIEARMKEGGGGDNLAVAWRGPATSGRTNVISGLYLAPYPLNYLPKATSITANVRRDAFTGAGVGRIQVSDANPNDVQSFTILSGNGEGIFTVDSSGWVRVANETALRTTVTPSFTLGIRVTDNGVPPLATTANAIISVVESNALSVTQLQREMFYGIGGSVITDLTGNAKYPNKPDALVPMTGFTTPADVADNYGSRVRANLVAPLNGSYRFFIASDDASQLKLGTTTNPATASVVASVATYTSPNVWNAFTSQMGTRTLTAGQRYYIEALQKEGGGGDHLSVAWVLPGDTATNIIDAAYLEPVDLNGAPAISSQSFRVFAAAPNGTVLGTVTASDGPLDTLTFKIIAGNTNNTFALDPANGTLSVADNALLANGTITQAVLTVAVQDSGMGGLFPLRTAQASITIGLASTNDPFAWLGAASNNLWSSPANWGGLAPVDGVRLVFGRPLQQTSYNDLAALTVRSIALTNGGFNLTGNPLMIQAGITNTGDNTISLPVALATAQTLTNLSGTLTLAGPVAVSNYTMFLGAGADIRLAGAVSGAGGINKSGPGRLLMQGTHSYTGPTVLAAASGTTAALEVNGLDDLNLSGSVVVLNGRMDLWDHNAALGGLQGSGMVYANAGSRTLTVGLNNASTTFSGTITNSTWATGVTLGLVKAGSGTQILSGSSGYSGGTTVRAGKLSFSNSSALGSGAVVLGDAGSDTNVMGMVAIAAVAMTNAITVSSNGLGSAILGTESFGAGGVNMIFGGPVALQRDLILQAGSDARTSFTNRITGTGGLTLITPLASVRHLTLSRAAAPANDFTGMVTISTNVWLQVGDTNSLANRVLPDASVVNFGPNSRLRLAATGSGDTEVVGALNSLLPAAGLVEQVSGSYFTLTVGGGNASGHFSGPILNSVGTLAFTKTGTGTEVLAGAGSFAGLCQVLNGTLVAAHSGALGSSAQGTTVVPGATLALSNNVTIATETLVLGGAGVSGTGAFRNDAGINAWNGNLTLSSAAMIAASSGVLSLGGAIATAGYTPTFDAAGGAEINVVNSLTGAGGLIKQGAGRLILAAPCAMAGPVSVVGGALALGTASGLGTTPMILLSSGTTLDASASPAGFTLGSGQTLQGNGTVLGTVRLNGTVRPGTSVGRLAFSGDTTLAGTTVMDLSVAGASRTNDVLQCDGMLTFGAQLIVTNLGPDQPALGSEFKLFTAAVFGPGAFSEIVLPPLSPDLRWDATTLGTDGTLRVVQSEPSTPPMLVWQQGAGGLTLSWPSEYVTYSLQGQTNTPAAGLAPVWYAVPGVSNNSYTMPLDPTVGSMFFRLVKP